MMAKRKNTYIHGTHPEEQKRLSELNTLTNRQFVGFLEINTIDSVLEVGSGLGILANLVAETHPDASITGVEISDELIDKAIADFAKTVNLRFASADAHSLDLLDNSFDVVYCRYLLEHVQDPEVVLGEIFRVLKPGGKIFIQENNILINMFYPECPTFDFVWKKFADVQAELGGDALIGKKLFTLLQTPGFRGIELSVAPEIHHYGMPTFIPWIQNLIGNIDGARKNLIDIGDLEPTIIDEAIGELSTLQKNAHASAYFYWNRARAVKPESEQFRQRQQPIL